jgi:hypothetical protein
MGMTSEQAQRLRVLLQEAFDMVLGKPVAFVLLAQDEQRNLEIVTNAANREGLPELLEAAIKIVRTPPDGTIAISDHRATGESADALLASGMERGHAAQQGAGPSTSSSSSDGAPTSAGAAVSERCWVKNGEEQCPNQAAGGLRVNFYATPAVQKRYGKRVMLSLIMDLPVCLACMPKVTPANVVNEEQWRAFSKVAQQRNSGVLADRSQLEIVLCHFGEPEYVALRNQMAKQRAANESQPAPEGPQQEGAGNGR